MSLLRALTSILACGGVFGFQPPPTVPAGRSEEWGVVRTARTPPPPRPPRGLWVDHLWMPEYALDVGCGIGDSTANMVRTLPTGAIPIGIDHNPLAVAEARRRYPHLTFVVADALHLPFDNAAFTTVQMRYALRHIEDPYTLSESIYRVLRVGGRLEVVDYGASHPYMDELRVLDMTRRRRHLLPTEDDIFPHLRALGSCLASVHPPIEDEDGILRASYARLG